MCGIISSKPNYRRYHIPFVLFKVSKWRENLQPKRVIKYEGVPIPHHDFTQAEAVFLSLFDASSGLLNSQLGDTQLFESSSEFNLRSSTSDDGGDVGEVVPQQLGRKRKLSSSSGGEFWNCLPIPKSPIANPATADDAGPAAKRPKLEDVYDRLDLSCKLAEKCVSSIDLGLRQYTETLTNLIGSLEEDQKVLRERLASAERRDQLRGKRLTKLEAEVEAMHSLIRSLPARTTRLALDSLGAGPSQN